VLAAFSRQRNVTFPLLSDGGSSTIKAYGLLNPAAQGAQAGIPYPGTFMLDARGRVTARFFEDYYVDRNTVSSILLRTGASTTPVAATRISTPQLDITAFASDSSVAVGNRFALVFDVTPRPGMHVYAPGASSYRVVSVAMTPQPFVQLLPVQYPASETYFFEPLDERVPVYQKPFRLIQEVLLQGTPEAQAALKGVDSLTLAGSFDYQACDDKVCYNPVSAPVSFTLAVHPLIRERPVVAR
jgi:hypothetical protein